MPTAYAGIVVTAYNHTDKVQVGIIVLTNFRITLDIIPTLCYTIFCNCVITWEVSQMEYMRVTKAAEKWGISSRRVRVLCAEGKIPGVIRKGSLYMIPENAMKPLDGRKSRSGVISTIEQKQERLNEMRPLTPGEVKRLQEAFMVEFTYNSNAIEGNTLTLKETAMVLEGCLLYTSPSPRDKRQSRMPSSA